MVPIRWVIAEPPAPAGGSTGFPWEPKRIDSEKGSDMKRTTMTFLVLLVLALALTGCTDANPSAVAPMPIDTAPPAGPTELTADAGRSTALLSWAANVTDHDLQGYLVYRLAFGQAWLLTDTVITESRFADHAPLRGHAQYAVTAVDASGNESAWVTVLYNYEPERPEITKD